MNSRGSSAGSSRSGSAQSKRRKLKKKASTAGAAGSGDDASSTGSGGSTAAKNNKPRGSKKKKGKKPTAPPAPQAAPPPRPVTPPSLPKTAVKTSELAILNDQAAALRVIFDSVHSSTVDELLGSGSPDRIPLLHLAAVEGTAAVLEVVLPVAKANKAVDRQDCEGLTALACAAMHGRTDSLSSLLAVGADPTVRAHERLGGDALWWACCGGHGEAARLLLSDERIRAVKGESNNEEDGDKPIWIAAYHGHVAVLEALLEAGADPMVSNAAGISCERAARERGQAVLLPVLVAAIKDRSAMLLRGERANQVNAERDFLTANAEPSGGAGCCTIKLLWKGTDGAAPPAEPAEEKPLTASRRFYMTSTVEEVLAFADVFLYDRDIDVGDPKKLVLRTAARKRELDNPSFLLSAAHLGIKSRTTIDVFVRSFD